MCLELGELDAAQKAYERAAALKFLHGTVWTWKVLADILDKRGDDAGALRAMRTGLQQYPRSIALNTALITMYLEHGKMDAARKAYEQAATLGIWRGSELAFKMETDLLRSLGR